MKYSIEQKLKKLKLLLEHYKKSLNTYNNPISNNAEKLWNASLFFANILLESDCPRFDVSEGEFENFTTKYKKKYNAIIDVEELFSKLWIRKVLGNIQIPSVIRRTARDYEDRKDNYNELRFIHDLKTKEKIPNNIEFSL